MGLISPEEYIPACSFELGEVIGAGRQHMIAVLGVHALLDSVFADTEEERTGSLTYLTQTLEEDFPETSYLPAQN